MYYIHVSATLCDVVMGVCFRVCVVLRPPQERVTNRELQGQLSKEKETAAKLEAELKVHGHCVYMCKVTVLLLSNIYTCSCISVISKLVTCTQITILSTNVLQSQCSSATTINKLSIFSL